MNWPAKSDKGALLAITILLLAGVGFLMAQFLEDRANRRNEPCRYQTLGVLMNRFPELEPLWQRQQDELNPIWDQNIRLSAELEIAIGRGQMDQVQTLLRLQEELMNGIENAVVQHGVEFRLACEQLLLSE